MTEAKNPDNSSFKYWETDYSSLFSPKSNNPISDNMQHNVADQEI